MSITSSGLARLELHVITVYVVYLNNYSTAKYRSKTSPFLSQLFLHVCCEKKNTISIKHKCTTEKGDYYYGMKEVLKAKRLASIRRII